MDIKETKEALIGINEFSLLLAKNLKDGFQLVPDATALVTELLAKPELKDALVEAAKGIQAVPAEIKDIDLGEGIELVRIQASYIPKFLEAIKK
jgi:predicted signal transduction protein with EAL and GGDEF domain